MFKTARSRAGHSKPKCNKILWLESFASCCPYSPSLQYFPGLSLHLDYEQSRARIPNEISRPSQSRGASPLTSVEEGFCLLSCCLWTRHYVCFPDLGKSRGAAWLRATMKKWEMAERGMGNHWAEPYHRKKERNKGMASSKEEGKPVAETAAAFKRKEEACNLFQMHASKSHPSTTNFSVGYEWAGF